MAPRASIVVSDLSSGGALRAYLLAQVLRQLDWLVEVVGLQRGPALYAEPPAQIRVTAVPTPLEFGGWRQAWRVLSQVQGEVICAVKPRPTSFGLALLKKWQTRRPLWLDMDDWELSWYGGDAWAYRPSLRQLLRDVIPACGALRSPDHPLYVRWLERCIGQANALTVDTSFLQQRFGGLYVPNGKDTTLFDPGRFDPMASRRKFNLAAYRVLLFPGVPRPHKGLEDLLTALDQINEPNYRLVMVGDNPYDDYDQQLIARWGRWIVTLPKYPVEQMPEVVAAAHVVVVPQRQTVIGQAQFPLKLTDGMAMAKPILATRVGDIPQILGESGYLVEPDSPAQLAEALHHIFGDWAAAEARGRQARSRCVAHYSTTAMAERLAPMLAALRSSTRPFFSASP